MAGTKRLYRVVGGLGLSFEVMQITADTDLRLAVFTAAARQPRPISSTSSAARPPIPGQLPVNIPRPTTRGARNRAAMSDEVAATAVVALLGRRHARA